MTPNLTPKSNGRGWAYTGTILGGAISIAANIAHSYIRPDGAPAMWSPEAGAVLSAMAWPIVLFVAVEILARTPWPNKLGYHLLRWIGLPPVAFVAALVSYRHLSGLLAYYGEEPLVQQLGPIAIDGLMLMATGALIATRPRAHITDATPANTMADTMAVTTSATTPTIASVPLAPTVHDQVPELVPAQQPAKRTPAKKATPRKAPAKKATTAAKTTSPRTRSKVAPTTDTITIEQADPTTQRHETVPTAPEQAPAPSAHDSLVTAADAAPPIKLPAPAALLTRARHLADAHLEATGEPITPGALAVRMRIDTDNAGQLLALLDLDPDRPRQPAMTANGASMDRTA